MQKPKQAHQLTSEEVAKLAIAALEDVKAQDIQVIDVREKQSITDFMIIATGTSNRQIGAMLDKVREAVKAQGVKPLGEEGKGDSDWVLLDMDDVIVHMMTASARLAESLDEVEAGAGAAMLVWQDGSAGTIGGGALEFQAATRARAMLGAGGARLDHEALGPSLGQCCGGAVTLLTEVYDVQNLPDAGDVIARAVDGSAVPLAVKRLLARARGEGVLPHPVLVQGWMVEPVARAEREVWVWGAGHVGRALADLLQHRGRFVSQCQALTYPRSRGFHGLHRLLCFVLY